MKLRWIHAVIICTMVISLCLNVFLLYKDSVTASRPVTLGGRKQHVQLGSAGRGFTEKSKVLGVNIRGDEVAKADKPRLVTDFRELQKLRKDNLLQACADLEFEERPSRTRTLTVEQLATLKHNIVIDKHKLLYCYLPKVSCTSWKRLFLVTNGFFQTVDDIKNPHTESIAAFRTLSQIPIEEANRKIGAYTHFIFVRNPFSRLLSAYREKIEFRNPDKCYFSQFITRWLKKSDPEYLNQRNVSGGYSFAEFVRYVIARRADNEHWNDQYQLCSPCLVEYDFIGKYETLRKDADDFLRSYVGNSTVRFPAPQKRPTHSSSDDVISSYYRQIPDDDLLSLIDCMYSDLRLFGYAIPESVKRPGLQLSRKYLELVGEG